MPEAAAVVLLDFGVVAAQFVGAQQKLGKIHQAGSIAGALVGRVDTYQLAKAEVARILQRARAQTLFLLAVDETGHRLGRPAVFRQVQRLERAFDEAQLVVRIHDLETLHQAGFLPVQAQHAVGDAVKGAHPHRAHRYLHHALDAAAHFRSRLVGEGHRQDREWRHALHRHQPGHAVDQYASLAGAGASQHQAVFRGRGDRLFLGAVEALDDGRDVFGVLEHCGAQLRDGCELGRRWFTRAALARGKIGSVLLVRVKQRLPGRAAV